MTTPETTRRITAAEAWTVSAGGTAGLVATYWDDAWHTVRGRDSTFIPPHLLLYGSMALVGIALATWVVGAFLRLRSLRALLATPGLALAVVAGITTAGAAPMDAVWHAAFGRDAVLWSPPHLLSVLATAVLVIAVLLGLPHESSPALRAALAAVLLGAGELVVLEYDTDVPQFSESLHLPLVVALGLGVAWIFRSVSGPRPRFAWSVLGYLTLRLAFLVVLAATGWIAPDLPIALLGLLLLDLPARTWPARWPLAAMAVVALQALASATGISSVSLRPTLLAAALLVPVLMAVLVMSLFRNRAARTSAALIILAAAAALAAPPARAHDPGQGDEIATAEMSVHAQGDNGLAVQIRRFEAVSTADVAPVRLLARRAGQTVSGPLARDDDTLGGTIQLPSSGLWLVYGELRVDDRAVEIWLPVQLDDPPATERRPVYVPAGAATRPASEYIAGAGLLAVGLGLVGWAAAAVRRRAAKERQQNEAERLRGVVAEPY